MDIYEAIERSKAKKPTRLLPPVLPDLDSNMSHLFCQLVQIRELGKQDLLYVLEDTVGVKDEKGRNAVDAPNFRLTFCGPAVPDRVYLTLGCTTAGVRQLTAIYNNYYASSTKKKKSSFDSWFAQQWKLFKLTGMNVSRELPVNYTTDHTKLCLSYADLAQCRPGPHPSWDNFISQFGSNTLEAEIFGAYLVSIFDEHNEGRQALFMIDQSGSTGKSCICDALKRIMGTSAAAISSSTLSSRFGLSSIFGRRLIMDPDCKNLRAISSEMLHKITGGDIVSVEYKGITPFDARVYCKVIIGTNDSPEVDDYRKHESSRIIPLYLSIRNARDKSHIHEATGQVLSVKEQFTQRLVSEFWHYLYDCIPHYKKHCPRGGDIIVPREFFSNISTDRNDLFETVRMKLTFDKSAKTAWADLRSLLYSEITEIGLHDTKYLSQEFKHYLMDLGIEFKKADIKAPTGRDCRLYAHGITIGQSGGFQNNVIEDTVPPTPPLIQSEKLEDVDIVDATESYIDVSDVVSSEGLTGIVEVK